MISNRSGRTIQRPSWQTPEEGYTSLDKSAGVYKIELTEAEERYYTVTGETYLHEFGFVGAGVGGGFVNTNKLHVLTYEQAMASPEKDKWIKALNKEMKNLQDHGVFKQVPIDHVDKKAKILSTKWVFKKKADGTYKARLTAQGYEQVDGIHYDETDKAAPVANDITIRIVLTFIVMMKMYVELVDVRGAFLNGLFEPEHKMHMEVPKGVEHIFPAYIVLLSLKAIYGTKQAAIQFWKLLCHIMSMIFFRRSKADPGLHYMSTKAGLVIVISWVDDLLICGPTKSMVDKVKTDLKKHFELDETGKIKEYVGCKIEHDIEEGWMRLTQPVMIQSFQDEFKLLKSN
jgi:hypothetical protein